MADLNQPASESTQDQGNDPTPDGRKFTQQDLDRFLAEDRRKHQQQREEATARAKREAEEKAALEKGEYQTLAEKRKAELEAEQAKAKSLQDELDALNATLTTQAEARLAKLPKELRELAPEGAKVQDLLSWITKAEANAEKLGKAEERGTPAGPSRNRRPQASTDDSEAINRHRANLPTL